MNYSRVANILGAFCAFISAMLVVPAAVAAMYQEWDTLPAIAYPLAGGVFIGLLVRNRTRQSSRSLYRREGLLIVTGCWLVAALIGCLPFIISGMIPRFEDALFETMSGFTTTGSTILTEIDGQPKGLMFWRSMTHWLGGMGIVVLFVAVLPALGVGGRLLYEFEVPGVETDDLKPRISQTASALWKIYLLMSLTEVALLLLVGLDLYDSVVHTFGTVATGGFSNYGGSVADFHSPMVEIIITIFMFLAGVNFTLYYRARRDGLKAITRDPEFRTYAAVVGTVVVILASVLWMKGIANNGGRAALDAAFTTVSVGTTTGYGTADFNDWPDILRLMLILLMFMGGSAGSTAGGMKVFRFMLLFRFISQEFRRFVRPHRVKKLMVGGQSVDDEMMKNVLAFFVVAMAIFAGASLLMAALGHDLVTSLTGVAATLWNIGPGLEAVGPTGNFAEVHPAGKVLLTFLMLLGRLEIFTAFVIFMPSLYQD